MRYALICAGVMLALLLVWPLAFAQPAVSARPDLPARVSMAIPPALPSHLAGTMRPPGCGGRRGGGHDTCKSGTIAACTPARSNDCRPIAYRPR